MKNLLIATTALVATATVAAADVKFSGYGRFGAKYTEGTAAVAEAAGTAFAAADSTALDATDDAATIAALEAAGIVVDHSVATTVAITTVAAQYDALLADVKTGGTLAAAVVAAQAAVDKSIHNTGASTDALDTALETAQANLDAANALIAAIAGTPAVAEVKDDISAASRLRLQIDMSAASDNGLSFAARYRIQAEENSAGGVNGAKFSVSTGGLTVAAGNICGAIECMPGLYNYGASAGIGLEGNGFLSLPNVSWDAYSSGGAGATNGVELTYSGNGLGFHVSSTEDSKTAVAVSYAAGGMTVALASQNDEVDNANDATIVTLGYDAGSVKVGLMYADADGLTSSSIKASTNVGGMQVYGFIGDREGETDNAYGLGVSYGLGGGTSFEAGMASNYEGRTTADAGFLFKF